MKLLERLKALRWVRWVKRIYTVLGPTDAQRLVWVIFEAGGQRVNYGVLPDSPDMDLRLRELMTKAVDRVKAAAAAEREL